MSETVAKQRPTVDLDDFERRLREAQGAPPLGRDSQHGEPRGYDDDPLAELARLVGERHDPYGDVFAQDLAPQRTPTGERHDPALGAGSPSQRLPIDFAAIEAGLRGAIPAHSEVRPDADPHLYVQPDMRETHMHEAHAQEPHLQEAQLYAEHEQVYADPVYAGEQDWALSGQHEVPARRSRRPIYAMVATIALGVIGIGVAFAYKGASSSPREIKTIMAAAGPTKIQPPADAASQDGQDANALDKSQAAPTKLVSREEQPVDLSQAVQDNTARNGVNSGTDASSVPVPLSPGQARDGAASADSAAAANGFGAGMPAPKKVKVVSVRPDGSIMPTTDSQQAATQMDAAPAPAPPVVAPTKPAKAVKSTSRVATAKPASIAAAAADDGDTTPPAKPQRVVKKPKPQRVASAEVDDKPAQPDAAAPDQAADAVEPKASGGGFAVQLAAPGSEAEAKAATSKLGKKFADALSGHRLGFHKADSNGHSVYRVRVGSLSREDASGLCEKVKSEGGTCFVAKN